MTLKDDLNMESKLCGFPWEDDRFHVSLGARHLEESQKFHFKLTSIWGAKCMDFHEQ